MQVFKCLSLKRPMRQRGGLLVKLGLVMGLMLLWQIQTSQNLFTQEMPSELQENAPEEQSREQLLEWLEQLDDDDYATRDEATAMLLKHRAQSLPLLREQLLQASAEKQARIEWLLSEISPPTFALRFLKFGERQDQTNGATSFDLIASSYSKIEPNRSSILEWQSYTDPKLQDPVFLEREDSVWISGRSPYLELHIRNEDNRTFNKYSISPNSHQLLWAADELENNQYKGKVECKWRRVFVLAELCPIDSALELAKTSQEEHLQSLYSALKTQFASPNQSLRQSAYEIEENLRRHQELPAEHPKSDRLQHSRSLLAAHSASKESKAQAKKLVLGYLDKAFDDFSDEDAIPLESGPKASQLELCALYLVGESENALNLISQGIDGFMLWEKHLAVRALNTQLHRTSGEAQKRIAEAVLQPHFFSNLPWVSASSDELMQSVQELCPEQYIAALPAILEEASKQGTGTLTRNSRSIIRGLQIAISKDTSKVDDWLESFAIPALASNFREGPFCLIRDALVKGKLSQEQTALFIEALGELYSTEKQLHRIEKPMKSLVLSPDLDLEIIRGLWGARLKCFDFVESGLQRAVYTDYTKRFGADSSWPKPPVGKNKEALDTWQEIGEKLRESLANLDARNLRAPEAAEIEEFNICIADFLIDTNTQVVQQLDFESNTYQLGRPYYRTAGDGFDATILVEYPNSSRNRISAGVVNYQEVGVPRLQYSISRASFQRVILKSNAFGVIANGIGRYKSHRTLVFIQPKNEKTSDQLITDWGKLQNWIVSNCNQRGSSGSACLKLVGELQLLDAIPELKALFDQNPTQALGLALLKLGNKEVASYLLENLNSKQGYRAIQDLREMIRLGVYPAFVKLLDLEEETNSRLRNQGYQIVAAYEEAMKHKDFITKEDTQRLLPLLIQKMDQSQLINKLLPILEKLTAQELGRPAGLNDRDRSVQLKARQEVAERWKSWWQEQQKSNPK